MVQKVLFLLKNPEVSATAESPPFGIYHLVSTSSLAYPLKVIQHEKSISYCISSITYNAGQRV